MLGELFPAVVAVFDRDAREVRDGDDDHIHAQEDLRERPGRRVVVVEEEQRRLSRADAPPR